MADPRGNIQQPRLPLSSWYLEAMNLDSEYNKTLQQLTHLMATEVGPKETVPAVAEDLLRDLLQRPDLQSDGGLFEQQLHQGVSKLMYTPSIPGQTVDDVNNWGDYMAFKKNPPKDGTDAAGQPLPPSNATQPLPQNYMTNINRTDGVPVAPPYHPSLVQQAQNAAVQGMQLPRSDPVVSAAASATFAAAGVNNSQIARHDSKNAGNVDFLYQGPGGFGPQGQQPSQGAAYSRSYNARSPADPGRLQIQQGPTFEVAHPSKERMMDRERLRISDEYNWQQFQSNVADIRHQQEEYKPRNNGAVVPPSAHGVLPSAANVSTKEPPNMMQMRMQQQQQNLEKAALDEHARLMAQHAHNEMSMRMPPQPQAYPPNPNQVQPLPPHPAQVSSHAAPRHESPSTRPAPIPTRPLAHAPPTVVVNSPGRFQQQPEYADPMLNSILNQRREREMQLKAMHDASRASARRDTAAFLVTKPRPAGEGSSVIVEKIPRSAPDAVPSGQVTFVDAAPKLENRPGEEYGRRAAREFVRNRDVTELDLSNYDFQSLLQKDRSNNPDRSGVRGPIAAHRADPPHIDENIGGRRAYSPGRDSTDIRKELHFDHSRVDQSFSSGRDMPPPERSISPLRTVLRRHDEPSRDVGAQERVYAKGLSRHTSDLEREDRRSGKGIRGKVSEELKLNSSADLEDFRRRANNFSEQVRSIKERYSDVSASRESIGGKDKGGARKSRESSVERIMNKYRDGKENAAVNTSALSPPRMQPRVKTSIDDHWTRMNSGRHGGGWSRPESPSRHRA